MSAVTGFTSLPDELSFLILSFFHHPRPLLNVAAVNSHLYGLVEDDALWRALFVLYKHERTPYEEINNISFKHLFKNRFLLEQNWDHKLNATVLPFAAPDWVARPNLSSSQQRPIQSLIATGGQRAPVMAVSCAKSQVRVYDLKTQSLLSLIPEDDVRALALVLDVERERDEQPHLVGRRLPAGVSRGWGNKQLRLITGNKRIRVWKVPLRKGVNPLTIEVPSRIRCMRAVDGTPLLLTGSINGSVRLWDIAKGELVRELEGFHDGILCLDALKSSRSSEDGCEGPVIWAVGGSSDCTAKIWNLKTWQMKSLRGHQQAVHRVFIDEDIVVTGSIDSTVRTWRLETGEPLSLFTTHRTVVSHMALYNSPLRFLLTVCFDGVAVAHLLNGNDTLHTSPRWTLPCSQLVDASSDSPYLVVGARDGVLSIFRLEQYGGDNVFFRPVRSIVTGLTTLYQLHVTRRGIAVGGLSKQASFSFLFYDFAPDA